MNRNHPERKICVFTGSRHGASSAYADAAEQLARDLVERGFGLVYGGGNVGLMNVIADAVLALGGHVHDYARSVRLEDAENGKLLVRLDTKLTSDGHLITLGKRVFGFHEEGLPLLPNHRYRVIAPFLRGYGGTRFRSEQTPRNGQQSVVAVDAVVCPASNCLM